MAGALAVTVLATNSITGFAAAAPDGSTKAEEFAAGLGISDQYNSWKTEWEQVKDDWTQVSLTPGSDASQLNFAWYSIQNVGGTSPLKLKIGEGKNMRNVKVYEAAQTPVADETDQNGNTYVSNKVTATGLRTGVTYYYCYEKESGSYTKPAAYTVRATDSFSFIFVGDPQIGSSNEKKAKKPENLNEEFYQAQYDAVLSDSFNWAATLNAAMEQSQNQAGFVVSAGDQIQTNAEKVQDKTVSEIEYTGYLSPDVLKSLPVATTVGNHDADNANYTYHFNTPNNSELGSNGIVGGDYYFTYGSVLFMMLNTQDTNVAEHKQFMENAIAANQDCKWRIVTLHQDIYGSAEHSNEPEITNLRYQLVPYFEANDVDMVLTGHDHAYSRSKMLLGGSKTTEYTDDEFDEQLEKDMDAGDAPSTLTTAPGNIKDTTTDAGEKKYLDYLHSIMDEEAIEQVKTESEAVINPDGILYMTANSSSGSKYYDLVPRMQSYIAGRWQEDVPTYSIINVDADTLSINTYRTDNNEKIDETFTIAKMTIDKTELKALIEEAEKNIVPAKADYTAESYRPFQQALAGAKNVLADEKATNSEVQSAILVLTNAKSALVKAEKKVKKVSISKVKVASIKDKVYTGKKIQPSVTVKVNGTSLKKGRDYSVSYSNNKYTGKAAVKIVGKGNYTGTKTVTFKIVPKKVSVKSLKASGKKKVTVTLKKAAGRVSGYEIKYAYNSKFSKAKTKRTTKTTYTLKSLTSRKTCYVKVRAYKTVSGKNIYGAYSKTIKVKVK